MKRTLSLLICITIVMSAFFSVPFTVSAESYQGSGTERDPYLLDAVDLKELEGQEFGNETGDLVYYKLTQDAVLDKPIKRPVNVSFDGGGHTVKLNDITQSYYSNDSDPQHGGSGMFAFAYGYNAPVIIKNLNLTGSVTGTDNSKSNYGVGAVIGYWAYSSSLTIENVTSDVKVELIESAGQTTGVGGIIGQLNSTSTEITVTNAINKGTVKGKRAGGIVGYINRTFGTTIERCGNYGDVEGSLSAAGIVFTGNSAGNVTSLTIKKSYNVSDNIKGGNENAAAIVYCHGYNSKITVEDCFNTGDIYDVNEKETYFARLSAVVPGTTGNPGANGSIKNCYNIGKVQYSEYKDATYATNITNMYHLTGTVTNPWSSVAVTEDVLDGPQLPTGFSKDIWEYVENSGYPYPQLIENPYKEANFSTYFYEAENCIEINTRTDIYSYYEIVGDAVRSFDSGQVSKRIKLGGIKEAGVYNIFQRTSLYEVEKDTTTARYVKISVGENGTCNSYKPKTVTFWPTYTWKYLGAVELKEGEDTIYFYSQDQKVYIDKILITNNFYFYPSENYPSQTDTGLTSEYGEAEFPEDKKGVHPRLIFNASDIDRIKANFTHWQNERQYEKMMDNSKTNWKDSDFVYANRNDIASTIEAKAFLYALNQDEKTGREAIDLTIPYLDCIFYETQEPKPGVTDIDRLRHFSVSIASRVYDWCYPLLTDEEKQDIFTKCMKVLAVTEGNFPIKSSPYQEGHQYEEKLLKDALMLAVAVYDEYPDLYNHLAGYLLAEGGFIDVLNHHYNNSSFHSQGDDYGNTRYQYSLWMTMIFEKLGVDHGVSEKQQYMAYQNIYRRRLDTGRLMTTGDKWHQSYPGSFNTTTCDFLAGNLYKDPYIKQSYYLNDEDNQSIATNYERISPVQHLILNDVTVEPKSIETLPLSKYMGDEQGVMTARTSWDKDSMIVSMQVPERYFAGHQQLDAGNFEIYYKNPLVIDSGVYHSFGANYDVNYTKRTVAHNSMLIYDPSEKDFGKGSVNDGGQRVKDQTESRTFEKYTEKNVIGEVLAKGYANDINEPQYTYLKGDIAGAYSDKVSEFTRSFMMLNFKEEGLPGALIVFDKVTAKNPSYKKSWLLHTMNEPEYLDGSVTTTETIDCDCCDRTGTKHISDSTTEIKAYKDETYVHNKTLLPKNPVITKLEGNWAGSTLYTEKVHGTPPDDESTGWRIEVSPSEENQTDYFLNVISVADDGYEVYDSALYECNNYVGVKIKDKVCFMSKERNRTTQEFTVEFTDNTNSDFEIIVADLLEGNWKVTDSSGNTVCNTYASEDAGVVSFTAKSGSYTLTKNDELFISSASVYAGDGIINGTYANGNVVNYQGKYITAFAKVPSVSGYTRKFGMKIERNGKEEIVYAIENSETADGKYGIIFYGNNLTSGIYKITPFATYEIEGNAPQTVYGTETTTIVK